MYVCMYLCMYVRLNVCTYVCLSVCMFVCLCVCMYVCMWICMYVSMSICRYACIHACLHVWVYIRMYVSKSAHKHACKSTSQGQATFLEKKRKKVKGAQVSKSHVNTFVHMCAHAHKTFTYQDREAQSSPHPYRLPPSCQTSDLAGHAQGGGAGL